MKEFTTSQLTQFATEAHSSGRRADVFDYWCEVGEMIAAFAIQTRGSHFQIPGSDEYAWLMIIPADSACSALCQVCDLARPRSLTPNAMDRARATLPKYFKHSSEYDPVASATRLLARAAVASADLPPTWATRLTTELFQAVTVSAAEFEASWSPEAARDALAREDPIWHRTPELQRGRAAYLYVRDREPDRSAPYMTVGLRGQPAPPSQGEVDRALAQCSLLAQGRLFPGPRITSPHPRYRRDSLLLHSALPANEKSIHVLLKILNQHCIDGWWLGSHEDIKFDSQDSCRADIAGWRRDRHVSDPRCEYSELHSEPTSHRPDWICEQLTLRTSAEDQQRKQAMYQRARVPWYWIVDMERRTVRILRLAGDEYHLELEVDSTRSVMLPPFESTEIDLETVLPPKE